MIKQFKEVPQSVKGKKLITEEKGLPPVTQTPKMPPVKPPATSTSSGDKQASPKQ